MCKIIVLFILFFPLHSFAKDELKKIRWSAKAGADSGININLFNNDKNILEKSDYFLRETGELVLKEAQMLGGARVRGTWKQSILSNDGVPVYKVGEVYSSLPKIFSPLSAVSGENDVPEFRNLSELKNAAKIFPAILEVRQSKEGSWESYWRVNYLSDKEDQLKFVLVNFAGNVLEKGELPWDGVDGKGLVFPRGPKLSELQEEPLRDLVGDGTLKGVNLWVHSVLNLSVWQPDLIFFFPQDDRRFDLSQVYFSIEQSFSWLKEKIGVEVTRPVEVRLHVGNNGVSNAAFYHQNTIYLGTGDGTLYKDMVKDPSVVTHESIHAVIDTYVGLPSEGEGGSFNEGFADLFTALILDNPRMGEASYLKAPFRRTLDNKLIAYKDFNAGVYQNGSIIGATFWDMKSYLGTEQTAKLAFRTLVRLGAGAKFDDFVPSLLAASEFLDNDMKTKVLQTAKARGWKVE